NTAFFEGTYASTRTATTIEPFPLGSESIYPDSGGQVPAESFVNGVAVRNPLVPQYLYDRISDNDGDGLTDFPADIGCFGVNDNDETNAACSNGIDDDGDGDIAFPADSGCAAATDPHETNPQGDDGIDNDGDGNVDFPADTG
ncbi:hypothetical protein, partial [Klebsiella pneumoniae]|uniref:hypothetical protein n=1 Tax=Klebsiella pneumoniae TaxID=573 RepID=UPI003A84C305